MYLLSQLLRYYATNVYLANTSEEESENEFKSHFLQSNLSVMQKAQTFNSFYLLFRNLHDLIDFISNKLDELSAFEQEKPKTKELL